MNIWLIHPTAGGPGLGRHWRPYWLAKAFQKLGHRVIVICSGNHHLSYVPRNDIGFKNISSVNYWFLKTPQYKGNNLGRLLSMCSFGPLLLKNSSDISAKFGKPDLVISSVPDPLYLPFSYFIARKYKAKVFLEVRDLWPQSLVEFELAHKLHPLVLLMSLIEKFIYKRVDRVISLLANAESYMQKKGLKSQRFVWIPNGIDLTEHTRVLENDLMQNPVIQKILLLKEKGYKIIAYTGAMGPPNSLENIITAAEIIEKSEEKIFFLLIGKGISKSKLEEQSVHLKNIQFFNEVEKEIVQYILQEIDCAVVAYRNFELYKYGISPNKLYEYSLYAPRTVIACAEEALKGMEDLVTARADPDNSVILADVLMNVLNHNVSTKEERISRVEKFNYSLLSQQYLKRID